MGFYGRIYEHMNEVFNRIGFKNAESNAIELNTETLNDFVIDAESHGDKLPIIAGNRWIQFIEDTDEHNNAICKIYHAPPAQLTNEEESQIFITTGEDYQRVLSDNTLLTEEERNNLQVDRENGLIYFGDSITVRTPNRDPAGHIINYTESQYKIAPLPRIEELINMTNNIQKLENIIGAETYPEELGTIAFRVETVENNQVDVIESAQQALNSAAAAAGSAAQSATAATEAQRLVGESTTAITNIRNDFTNYDSKLTDSNTQYTLLVRTVGASNASEIQSNLNKGTLLEWAIDMQTKVESLEKTIEELNQTITRLEAYHNDSE